MYQQHITMEEMYEAHRIASEEDCQEDEAELMLAEDLKIQKQSFEVKILLLFLLKIIIWKTT